MKGPNGPDWAQLAAQMATEMGVKAAKLAAGAQHHHRHAGHAHSGRHGEESGWKADMRGDQGGFGWVFGPGWGPPPGPWARPPWSKGWRGHRARKGNVRAAILALLAEEPRNGYQIIQEINARSGGAWKPSPGAVYPALQQLADEGLIQAAENGGGRKTFSLTDEGRTHVEEHAEELGNPWAEMTPEFGDGVPDLFKQAAQTGSALMQIVHTGSADQVAQATRLLAETRRGLYRILADEDSEEE
jgi:DNA-binding PadR family transcriptional regulator